MIEFKKTKISKVLNFLGRISGYIEILLLFLYLPLLSSFWSYYWLFYALPIWLLYINGKYEFKTFMSKFAIRQSSKDYIVMGHEGKQGSGKSSLTAFILSELTKNDKKAYIITNVPMRINGKFTYKVTPDILNLEAKVPPHSYIFLDEWVLIFNNLDDKLKFADLQSTAYLEQLYRHFTDKGNIFGASVSMSRAPKIQRDNFSAYRFMDGLTVVKNSYIIAPIIKLVAKLLKYEFDYGFMAWRTFLIRDIEHENYNFDLSGLENKKGTSSPRWSFAEVIVAYNNKGRFDYDSKFMQHIYNELPLAELEQFDSLEFKKEDLRKMGWGELTNFFDDKMKIARLRKFAKEKEKENNVLKM